MMQHHTDSFVNSTRPSIYGIASSFTFQSKYKATKSNSRPKAKQRLTLSRADFKSLAANSQPTRGSVGRENYGNSRKVFPWLRNLCTAQVNATNKAMILVKVNSSHGVGCSAFKRFSNRFHGEFSVDRRGKKENQMRNSRSRSKRGDIHLKEKITQLMMRRRNNLDIVLRHLINMETSKHNANN